MTYQNKQYDDDIKNCINTNQVNSKWECLRTISTETRFRNFK